MADAILIVGGYGAVGRRIATILVAESPLAVVVAGRNPDRATGLPPGVAARLIDLDDPGTWEAALEGTALITMCMDQRDPAFVASVLERGIGYVDVTAGDDFFRAVEALEASRVNATALLSVGVAPGITNLLAAAAAADLDRIERIDIGILLGLGDEHGEAAVAWTVENVFAPGAGRPAVMDFGPGWGERRAYAMNFGEQHSIARTMPGARAATRLALDSRLFTAVLFWLGRTFTGNRALIRIVTKLSGALRLGSDACVVTAVASGARDGAPARSMARFSGRRQGELTAQVAALGVLRLLDGAAEPGVRHSHEVLDPLDILAAVAARTGATFSPPQVVAS
jgi:saccharopine dehydrogenase (NAD+, L-lysine forming)